MTTSPVELSRYGFFSSQNDRKMGYMAQNISLLASCYFDKAQNRPKFRRQKCYLPFSLIEIVILALFLLLYFICSSSSCSSTSNVARK